MSAERIELAEGGYQDAWRCVCGNSPSLEGFYPCTERGWPCEPELGGFWQGHYRCDRCGRVIEGETGEVLGCAPYRKCPECGSTFALELIGSELRCDVCEREREAAFDRTRDAAARAYAERVAAEVEAAEVVGPGLYP